MIWDKKRSSVTESFCRSILRKDRKRGKYNEIDTLCGSASGFPDGIGASRRKSPGTSSGAVTYVYPYGGAGRRTAGGSDSALRGPVRCQNDIHPCGDLRDGCDCRASGHYVLLSAGES